MAGLAPHLGAFRQTSFPTPATSDLPAMNGGRWGRGVALTPNRSGISVSAWKCLPRWASSSFVNARIELLVSFAMSEFAFGELPHVAPG
jgi:hypothetical protein